MVIFLRIMCGLIALVLLLLSFAAAALAIDGPPPYWSAATFLDVLSFIALYVGRVRF
jgi:hypothetical protein